MKGLELPSYEKTLRGLGLFRLGDLRMCINTGECEEGGIRPFSVTGSEPMTQTETGGDILTSGDIFLL